jgi:hypothetical protein
MNPAIIAAIASLLDATIRIWSTHAGKPADWKPTAQDISDIMADVDDSTPENMKKAARERLGLPPIEM